MMHNGPCGKFSPKRFLRDQNVFFRVVRTAPPFFIATLIKAPMTGNMETTYWH